MRRAVPIVALLILAWAGTSPAHAQDGRCHTDWSDAAPIVKRENLVPAREVHEQVRKRHLGEPIRITLCEEKGQFVYRLVLQDGAGKVKNLTLDARKPF